MTGVEDDVLATTGYTTNYILQKLHQNCPKYMQQLNENRVVKVRSQIKII
jgi:NADH:ubiquinone oxidoreductase subunit D